MSRLDARCSVEIPLLVHHEGNQVPVSKAFTSNLGLRGAFLSADLPLEENTVVRIVAKRPDGSPLEFGARVVRREENGMAVKFLNLVPEVKSSLWEYVAPGLERNGSCPYCGDRHLSGADCVTCGFPLDFSAREGLESYEQKRLGAGLERFEQATGSLNRELERIEERFLARPAEEERLLEETTRAIHRLCEAARELEELADGDTQFLRREQERFWRKTPLLSKGNFIEHARTWPRGYPGDYRIIENVYRNIPTSEGLGYLLDRHFLNAALAVGVRGRLAALREALSKELGSRRSPEVLNLACGSCREVFELARDIEKSGARFTCTDLDEEALKFALTRLSMIGMGTRVRPMKYNVLRMVNHERNVREFGHQDVIYSVGLFDYLADEVLHRLFSALYALLKPGGKLIMSFKDSRRYVPQEYRWIADWSHFYQRTREESRALVEAIGAAPDAVESFRDPSQVMIFYVVAKDA